jgi:hypothetical protein
MAKWKKEKFSRKYKQEVTHNCIKMIKSKVNTTLMAKQYIKHLNNVRQTHLQHCQCNLADGRLIGWGGLVTALTNDG